MEGDSDAIKGRIRPNSGSRRSAPWCNSREFIQRHNEIMALCDAAGILPMCEEMKRGLCDGETDSKCQRCHAVAGSE